MRIYKVIRFVSGRPLKKEFDDATGKQLSATLLNEHLGLQLDEYFRYYNASGEYSSVYMRNLKSPIHIYDDVPENAHPDLKERYFKAIRNVLKENSHPDWFRIRFARAVISNRFFNEERFVILARRKAYFLNSSGCVECIKAQKDITILEEYEEGEFPNGTLYLSDFFHSLNEELQNEKFEYLKLKEAFPDLLEN